MKSNVFVTLAMALLPAVAFAIDGQLLINQSTVVAAGGFPYVIAAPGSYKLSGNLQVPPGLTGIQINASNVTLDLNGFTINAENPDSASITTGINFGVGVAFVAILNGQITNFYNPLTVNNPNAIQSLTLKDLFLTSVPNISPTIPLGSYGLMWHVTAPVISFYILCPSVVTETITDGITIAAGGVGNCALANNAVF